MGLFDAVFGPSKETVAAMDRLRAENDRLAARVTDLAAQVVALTARATRLDGELAEAHNTRRHAEIDLAADRAALARAASGNPWYRAFSDFELPVLEKIAAAKNQLPDTLRKLIVTLLAEPTDLSHLGAIKDYIIEEMRLPPYAVVAGEKVDLTARRGVDWWARRSGLGGNVALALTLEGDRAFSVADLCHTTERELDALSGIGPKSLAKIKKWLADLGLSLRDPAAE